MSVLDAELAILDEIDSGLDIDALRDVANAVNGLKREETATLMVTHYKVCLVSLPVCTLLCSPTTASYVHSAVFRHHSSLCCCALSLLRAYASKWQAASRPAGCG